MKHLLVLSLFLAGCAARYAAPPPPMPEALGLAPAPAPKTTADEVEYVAKQGDTLGRIAEETLGWTLLWRHLMEWNKLNEFGETRALVPGSKVFIPDRFRILLTDRSRERLSKVSRRPPPVPWSERYRFAGGERLDYKVKYLAITAGYATMSVRPPVIYRGSPCLHFSATARSTLVFFYKVEDRVEALAKIEGLMPQRFEKHIREGHYSKDQAVTFDLEKMRVKSEGKTSELGADCRDIMSAFFHVRTLKLPKPGGSVEVCVHTNNTNYALVVDVLKRETVHVPAGTFRTIVVRPRMKFEGLFRQQGDMLIWLTDDAAHVPVLVKAKVFLLGSVNIILIGKNGENDDADADEQGTVIRSAP